jgi:hypothetical protein
LRGLSIHAKVLVNFNEIAMESSRVGLVIKTPDGGALRKLTSSILLSIAARLRVRRKCVVFARKYFFQQPTFALYVFTCARWLYVTEFLELV